MIAPNLERYDTDAAKSDRRPQKLPGIQSHIRDKVPTFTDVPELDWTLLLRRYGGILHGRVTTLDYRLPAGP